MAEVAPRGQLVVLAGPSAVGKSTVVSRLRGEVPDLYFSVSMTTRDPRPGEVLSLIHISEPTRPY